MSKWTRREFLGNSSKIAVWAGLALPSVFSRPARARTPSPNDKIGLALIGCGGMGRANLKAHLNLPEITCLAVCDVDQQHLKATADEVAAKIGKRPDEYRDFRRIMDRKDIDVVIVATPDHWHALPTIYACQTGKDVYVEKPLATSIAEGRAMVQAARKYNCVVQMGTQQRSSEHYQAAVNFVKSGALGKIRLVRVWAYLDWVSEVPVVPDSSVPDAVDYDFWLGPAPQRPFNSNRFHFNFRWFWDYAGGLMTDWGAHMLDIANLAMDVVAPKSVMSLGGKYGFPQDATETPDTQQALFEYADFSMIWEHALGVGKGPHDREHGVAFHGNNGILVVDRGGWEVFPETNYADGNRRGFKMPGLPRQGGSGEYHQAHVQNFIDCVKNRQPPRSDVEIGHNSMIACHLGNMAVRLRRRIEWDVAREKVIGDPEAQAMVGRTYREPWKLPAL